MKHYGLTQWVDFARGVIAEESGRVMRDHLNGGLLRMPGACRILRKAPAYRNASGFPRGSGLGGAESEGDFSGGG